MRKQAEKTTYPDVHIAFDGSAVTAVTARFPDRTRVDVPVEGLGESFGRTAAKVLDWWILDQQAKDCFVFGEPLVERECVSSIKLMLFYEGVWVVSMDESCRGGTRTVLVEGSAMRAAVDELVAGVQRAVHELAER